MKGKIFSYDPIIAIDIGTTKICVLIAQPMGTNELEIIGIGKAPSDGLKKGIVVDINKTIYSIQKALDEASFMADYKINSAVIGISGSHIQSINSQGAVPIKGQEVTPHDIANVIASAKAIPVPEGQQILHVLPQYFVIDSQQRVHNPLGMHGIRLEVQVHIITGSISCVQNLIKCCHMTNISVDDIVLEQLASALAVLSSDERQLGVGILDIGGGTSDFALYYNSNIFYTHVIPVAGNQFTNDLALGLRTTLSDAERIKKEFGVVDNCLIEHDQLLVESVEGELMKEVTHQELRAILEPRACELFSLVNENIMHHKLKSFMPAGIVLTGGGALLEGMQTLAKTVFDLPVRIGYPNIKNTMLQTINYPMYATGYGLLLHAWHKRDQKPLQKLSGPLLSRVTARMKSWASDFF